MSGINMSRLSAFSHARAIHCDAIALDLHGQSGPPRRSRCTNFLLSNDRGALVAPTTFRLPLDRHVCAEVLWRFFGDMGEIDSDAVFTEKILASQCREMADHQELSFLKLEKATAELLHSPSYMNSKYFGEMYCVHLYMNSKKQVLAFTRVLFRFYAMLSEHHPTRPEELDDGQPWDEEIRYKKNCKWVERLDEHYDEAKYNAETGDECFEKGQIAEAAWHYMRALFDICPWFPSEWYMTDKEAATMSEIIWHCLLRLSYYAWTLSTEKADDLARHTARIVFSNPYISRQVEIDSMRMMSRAQWDLEAKRTDRQESYYSIVESDSEIPEDKAVCFEPRYYDVYFSPFDVVRWASERHAAGVPSAVYNFDLVTAQDIEADAMDTWRAAYGDDKLPFTWDGTEDEALKEELGQPPRNEHLPFSQFLPRMRAQYNWNLVRALGFGA